MQSYTTVGINSKSLWEGIVRIDNNFDDYVSSITNHEVYNQLTIEDVKFHHLSYYTFENIPNIKNLPNVITIMVFGKTIQEYMKCTEILGYEKIEKIKGFFRKTKYFEDVLRIKGFKLEPITSIPESPVPCLTSYRADIGKDNAFDISQQGIITFSTGSHSAESQLDSARQSLTCVFVASNEKPFVASVRKKGSIFTMKCDNNGIDEESHDKGKEIKKNLANEVTPEHLSELISHIVSEIQKALSDDGDDGWRTLFPGRRILEKYQMEEGLGKPPSFINSLIKEMGSSSKMPSELKDIIKKIESGTKLS